MSFKELNLEAEILKAIDEAGFTLPTPIQQQAIPQILEGYDLRASAQTGTGKTAAYLLPVLSRLLRPRSTPSILPRVLILVPTRELALQVAAEAEKYSRYLNKIKTVCIYGGAPYPIQNRQLARPHEILVATPGRLIDHLERGRADLSQIETFILDEADRMLDMGFVDPVEQIAAATPQERQTLLFSATMQGSVLRLSKNLLNNPREITVSHSHEKHKNIEQRLYYADDLYHKYRMLNHLLEDPEINQALIFTATKRFADQLVDELYDKGIRAAALHGDMNQRQRTRTITRLRQGEIRFLIATDVAARGIDVQTITHVINFDLPRSVEDYVHRIGRTGRAGANGLAFSFAAHNERHLVTRIEDFTGQPIAAHVIPGMEPTARKSAPPKGRRGPPPRNRSAREHRGPPREMREDRGPPREMSGHRGPPRESRPPREMSERRGPPRENRPPREMSERRGPPREMREDRGPPREMSERRGPPREMSQRSGPPRGKPRRRPEA